MLHMVCDHSAIFVHRWMCNIIEKPAKQEEWLMSWKHTEMMRSKNEPHQTWLWTQSLQDSPAPSTWSAALPCGPCCCNTVSQTADEKDQSQQPSPGSCHQSYSKYSTVTFNSKLRILMHVSSNITQINAAATVICQTWQKGMMAIQTTAHTWRMIDLCKYYNNNARFMV